MHEYSLKSRIGKVSGIIRPLLMRARPRPHRPAFPRPAVFAHVSCMHFDPTVIAGNFEQIVKPRCRFRTQVAVPLWNKAAYWEFLWINESLLFPFIHLLIPAQVVITRNNNAALGGEVKLRDQARDELINFIKFF